MNHTLFSEDLKCHWYFYEGKGPIPGDTQVLLLTALRNYSWQCSGNTWDAGDQTRVGCVQGKSLIRCTISPVPTTDSFKKVRKTI